jgi:hypothetical protein
MGIQKNKKEREKAWRALKSFLRLKNVEVH